MPDPTCYEGWAPCIHGDDDDNEKDEEAKTIAWAQEILDVELLPGNSEGITGLALWRLADLPIDIQYTFGADQWVGVWSTGHVGVQTVTCFIQGDAFWLALTETYRWWKAYLEPKPQETAP